MYVSGAIFLCCRYFVVAASKRELCECEYKFRNTQLPTMSSHAEHTAMGTHGVQSHAKVTELQRQRHVTFSLVLRSCGTLVFYVLPVTIARLVAHGKGHGFSIFALVFL